MLSYRVVLKVGAWLENLIIFPSNALVSTKAVWRNINEKQCEFQVVK